MTLPHVSYAQYFEEEGINNIIITADGMTLLHDVIYKIKFQDGTTIKGKSNLNGTIILDSENKCSFLLELDLEPVFYTEEYHLDFYPVYQENEELLKRHIPNQKT